MRVAQRVVGAEAERLREPSRPERAGSGNASVLPRRAGAAANRRTTAAPGSRQAAAPSEQRPPPQRRTIVGERPERHRRRQERHRQMDLREQDRQEAEQERTDRRAPLPPRGDHRHDKQRQDTRRPDLALEDHGNRIDRPQRRRPEPAFAIALRHPTPREQRQCDQRNTVQRLHRPRQLGRHGGTGNPCKPDQHPQAHAGIEPADTLCCSAGGRTAQFRTETISARCRLRHHLGVARGVALMILRRTARAWSAPGCCRPSYIWSITSFIFSTAAMSWLILSRIAARRAGRRHDAEPGLRTCSPAAPPPRRSAHPAAAGRAWRN